LLKTPSILLVVVFVVHSSGPLRPALR
jgi:hypothetical protein